MKLIGLMGAEQAGKSTAARFLADHGFKTVSFAAPFKDMLQAGFGLTHAQVYGSEKEIPCLGLCGRTPRYMMQTLGSEWGRKLIGDNLWVDTLKARLEVMEVEHPNGRYMIEDVRFDNEVEAIRDLGGEIWLVRRPDVEPRMDAWTCLLRWLGLVRPLHVSSTGWARMDDADNVLWNDGTPDLYHSRLEDVFKVWLRMRPQEPVQATAPVEEPKAVELPIYVAPAEPAPVKVRVKKAGNPRKRERHKLV